MDTLLKILDTSVNFWVAHPNFLSIGKFSTFHEQDKSKKKDKSSRIMWAIAFLVDLHPENTWRNKPEADKKPVLAEDIIGDKDFDWDSVQDLVNEYLDRCMSIPKKELRNFLNKIHQRQSFIDRTPFTLDDYNEDGKLEKGTATQLDKMMVDTAKVWAVYDDLMEKFAESEEDGQARGGRAESASESGLI
jgi:hypothetical protein